MKTKSYGIEQAQKVLMIWLLCIMLFVFTDKAAVAQPYIGEIRCGGWNFCPAGWWECDGQPLPISENPDLYGRIGTTYGGNGTTTFGVPNLKGRTLIHQGQGQGLSSRTVGQTGGAETVTLTSGQMPVHTHEHPATAVTGTSASPVNALPANAPASDAHFSTTTAPDSQMASSISDTGGSQPHDNLQPYLAIICCISLFGL